MSPDSGPGRSWSARLSRSIRNTTTIGSTTSLATPTAIAEHPARLQEASKLRGTSTQATRSRYVRSGEPAAASRLSGMGGITTRELKYAGGGNRGGSRSGKVSLEKEQPFNHPQERHSSSEAFVARDGAPTHGSTNSETSSVRSSTKNRSQAGLNRATGRGGGGAAQRDRNKEVDRKSGGSGSALGSGGRNNSFFGSDYTSSGAKKTRGDQSTVASKLPVGVVGGEVVASPGVPGSSDLGVSVGGAASTAPRAGETGDRGAGKVRRGARGAVATPLEVGSNPNNVGSSSGDNAASPRKEEGPPGFDPLDTDTGDDSASAMSSGRQHRRRDQRFGRDAAAAAADETEVQVAFPPHFEDRRKGSSGSSGSEDDGSVNKPRGSSGESLGTKSGSTSLLSMMSESPRSLATAHDSPSGSPPRSPLSDHSSPDGYTARAAAVAKGSRHVGSVVSRAHEAIPAVSVGVVSTTSDEGVDLDDMDVPSAHPTPLSAFGGGDTGLPSDHPTPDSSHAASSRSRNSSGSGSQALRSGPSGDAEGPASSSSRSVNPPPSSSSSSFMDKLKYWSGASSRHEDESKGLTVAAVTRIAGQAAQSSAGSTAVSPRKIPEIRDGGVDESSKSASNSTSSHGSAAERHSGGGGAITGGRQFGRPRTGPPPSYSESIGSEVDGISPSELRGCPVMPFDSVTSDAMSAHCAAPPPPYRSVGVVERVGREAKGPGPGPQQQQQQRSPRQQSQGSGSGSQPASSRHAHAGEVQTRLPSPTDAVPTPTAPPAARTYSKFGASHSAELQAMRRARQEVLPFEDVKEEDSEMGWDAKSDESLDEEKSDSPVPFQSSENASPLASTPTATAEGKAASPRAPPRYLNPKPSKLTGRTESVEIMPQQMQQLRNTPRQEGMPPPYMAIVEAANVRSALDTSSTSEQDTSPSEDDGGMMAEILTDRLMEVCNKMEQVTAVPEDELNEHGAATGGGGDSGLAGLGAHKRRSMTRRRQLSNASSRAFHSVAGADAEEKYADSDDGNVIDAGAAARKLRRDRMRKRTKSRQLAAALAVPKDRKGEVIDLHTAAYNGDGDALSAYISQGGDLEIRDRYQATALMLCTERGHTGMAKSLLLAGADVSCVDENGNSALHLASFYGRTDAVELLLSVDADVSAVDTEGRTPLDLASDPAIRRMIKTEETLRQSGQTFDLLAAVEVNDTLALAHFIGMGQEACGYPHNPNAVAVAAERLRLDRTGRGGMTATHLAAFHGYSDVLRLLLEAGSDPNAVCDDGETPLHTACTGGSTLCATLLLEHGANPLATDANGLVPCEKHVAGGRLEMKRLLELKAFQATPANLLSLRAELAELALQLDAEEDLFVRKGVAIKYLRRALKKKDADIGRLRQTVDARDMDIRNLRDRMDSVHQLLRTVAVQ